MGLELGSTAAAGLKGGHRQVSVLVLQLLEKGVFFRFAEGNSGDGCGVRDEMRYFEDNVSFVITLFVSLL